ncbi:hypothetical protein [Frigidibacter sp. ROC022]|uniref:hypothetical protein n=1 Tax=Frigidibacter sp. ROC022 TaxID=2971796 RepID=UPI00215AC863|nr:hypothetical protein [Frigidibacter sp. ROC022]MCR8722902.1 hypothetical protein [Frigidibacter sp. ROC022]
MSAARALSLACLLLTGCMETMPGDGSAAPAGESAPEDASASPDEKTASAGAPAGEAKPAAGDPADGEVAAARTSDQPLPFGEVATACGVRGRALGQVVARYPARGAAQWKLHDTDPEATGPRNHYVTGFKDGCPRRVTGALGLFGTAALHETWRYRKDNRAPWSETDTRYEALKAQICGTTRGTPCPASRLAAMQRKTAFVTFYPRYGAEAGWFVMLMSEGRLIAASISG